MRGAGEWFERENRGRRQGGVIGSDLEIIPETPNDIAVRNQRTFVRDSCMLLPGRAKSIIDKLQINIDWD